MQGVNRRIFIYFVVSVIFETRHFFLLSQSCDICHLVAFAWCHIYSVYCYQIVSCAGSTIKRKISMMQARLFRDQLLSYALLLFLGVFQNVLNTKVLVAWTERSFVFSAESSPLLSSFCELVNFS